jgi:uncharacterized membrane protein
MDGMDPEASKKANPEPSNPATIGDPPSGGSRTVVAKAAATQSIDPAREKKLRETVETALGSEVSPENRATVTERVVRRVETLITYQGPIPPPGYLQGYESACPGAATRIIAMAEKAQDRQENRFDKAMDYEYGDRRLGLILGFAALVVVVGAGVIVIALGQVTVGSGLLAAGFVGTVIGTFVHGRRALEDANEAGPSPQESAAPQISAPRAGYFKRLWDAVRSR